MSEHTLSIKLIIRLIEQLAEVDLPSFVFEQLDQLLAEVTYFKLINLQDNIDLFLSYLHDMADNYYGQMHDIVAETTSPAYALHIYAPYFTDKLYAENRKPTCGLKDLLKIKQRYLVMITLMSKEFMYKKQKKSLLTPLEVAVS
jgi:hypothetical protein